MHSCMLYCMLLSCMNIVCYFWHWYQHSLLMWLLLFYCTCHLFPLCISHIPLRLLQRSIWAWVMLSCLILTVRTVWQDTLLRLPDTYLPSCFPNKLPQHNNTLFLRLSYRNMCFRMFCLSQHSFRLLFFCRSHILLLRLLLRSSSTVLYCRWHLP